MPTLTARFRHVRRRVLGIGAVSGLAWALAAATAIVLFGVWLDLLWDFSPQWRMATLWAAGIGGALLFGATAIPTARAVRNAAIARRLDRAGNAGGRILTGWELACGRWGIRNPALSPLSAGMAGMAVADAAAAAALIPLSQAAPIRSMGRSLKACGLLWFAAGALAIGLPDLARTQWNRFVRPLDDVPPFSTSAFEVAPGDVSVLYGGELEIRVMVVGSPVDRLELILESAAGQEPPLPMFPEPDGTWRAVLAKVIEPSNYHVRAYRTRSRKYHIDVITVPLIESARVRIIPPEYTHRLILDGPMPKGGVSGLPGTQVEVYLRSNRPLRGGSIKLWSNRSGTAGPGETPAQPGEPITISMQPVESGDPEDGAQEVAASHVAVGRLTIAGDGKFECRVIDRDGQSSQQTFSGSVVMLMDQRPFLRIVQPPKMSLAVPNAILPILLSAEDDCGISRLQLFRSLNDSRPLPFDLPLPDRPSRRLNESIRLALDGYGLAPGDVVKLFGRVEDNDPACVKGAESTVVAIRIVSQEDFERMLVAQEGIEAMLSKYHAAHRRLETLAEQLDALRDELEKQPADENMSEETRERIKELEESMRWEAEEISKSIQELTPFDLDKNLAPRLQELADRMNDAADDLKKLEGTPKPTNQKMAEDLKKLADRLALGRDEFDRDAYKPLEYFEAVYPLLADQERFAALAQWQNDLAERSAALRGRDGEDNPSLKARMRDLEQEQQQIRDSLARLLEDIEEHAQRLPEEPSLVELRESALKFVEDVMNSGVTDVMAEAENAWNEFAPTRAHRKAQEAAEILMRFVKECEGGMGGLAQGALIFQPSLAKNLGDTIAQMQGGMNGQGGYGMSGGIGLYGALPAMSGRVGRDGSDRFGRSGPGAGRAGRLPGDNPDEDDADEPLIPGAAGGAAEAGVPVRYLRQVGQYFQRIAEETGESRHD